MPFLAPAIINAVKNGGTHQQGPVSGLFSNFLGGMGNNALTTGGVPGLLMYLLQQRQQRQRGGRTNPRDFSNRGIGVGPTPPPAP